MTRGLAGVLIVALVLGAGCTATDTEDPVESPPPFADGYELIADQPYLPRRTGGNAVLVTAQDDMRKVWRHYQLGGRIGEVIDGETVALFVGTGESGSCPIELEEVTVVDGDVDIATADSGGPCTADFNPRTFVFEFQEPDVPEAGGTVSIQGADLEIEGVSALR